MKTMILVGAAMAALVAGQAGAQTSPVAQVSISAAPLGAVPTPGIPSNALSTTINFDDPYPAGFSVVGGTVQSASNSLGSNPTGSSNYLTTSTANGSSGASILAPNGFFDLGLDWGSVDGYNTLSLLDAAGNAFYSVTGGDVQPLFNFGSSSARVNLLSSLPFYGVSFASSQPAFEVDNVSFSLPATVAAVPEPSAWAMIIVGFGAVGFAMRRRKFGVASAAVAA